MIFGSSLAHTGRRLAAIVFGSGWRRIPLAGLLLLATLVPAAGRDKPSPILALAPVEEVAAGFREPGGVLVDEAGAIYLSDREAGTVTHLSPEGRQRILVRRLDKPLGLALDRDGGLLIVEAGQDRLLRREPSGTLSVLVSGIKQSRWLAVAEDGGVYITARGLRRDRRDHDEGDEDDGRGEVILRLGADRRLSVAADGFEGLQGIGVHGQALYAASQRRHGEGTRQGSSLVRFPIQPDGSLGPMGVLVRGQLRNPMGLAVDALGGVFITAERLHGEHERDDDERDHGRQDDDDTTGVILKWRPDGRLVTFATGLTRPRGLALEALGGLLVAEGRRLLRFHAPAPPAVGLPPFTNQSLFTVRGTTDPHARLDLLFNEATSPLTATADAAGAFSLVIPLGLDTENQFTIFATAHGGDGLSSAAAEARLTHDGLGPSVVWQSPSAGAFVRGLVPVQAQATDSSSGVASLTLQADGQALTATLSPPPPAASITVTATLSTTTLADGTHTLTAAATDRAGNSQQATRNVIVDNTPPETKLTGGPSGEISQTSATFTFAGTDNLTSPEGFAFAWRLDGGPFTDFSSSMTATVTGLAQGPHTFEVKARDLAGNEDPTPATRAFSVSLGPTITRVDPDRGTIGALITIHGGGFEPGATQVAFNGTAATIRTITAAAITTTVPPGATTGVLAVTTSRGTASRPFIVLTTQDFAIRVAPADGRVLQGASTTYTIELVSPGVTVFTGLATLAVEGLPSGIMATFGSPTFTGGQRGTLTLSASGTAAVGVSSFTVRATAPGETGTLSRSATVNLTVLAGGRTALVGQVTFVDGRPIQGVKLTLDGQPVVPGVTDAGGNFEILDPPAGTRMLGIDANVAEPGLPIYGVDVILAAGQITQLLPFRITPPPGPERFTPINNATADQVITDARFPGMSITLPAGVTIVGWDGVFKTRVAIERLNPEQLPVPPPPFLTRSLYQIFFGTPMGGLPSAPLPVTLPNDQDLAPGAKAEIWYYDAAPFAGVSAGWRLAGAGTVSEDGTRVVSDSGVGLERFCGVCGVACIKGQFEAQPTVNPDGPKGGDPVDLGTGIMTVDKTDLILPGLLPAVVRRTYNPHDPFGGVAGFELPTGPGWTLSVDVVLLEDGANLRRLILPGNARFQFPRQPDGSFINTTHPIFAGAVLTQTDGAHTLRFKGGTLWRFATGWRPRELGNLTGLWLLVEQSDRNGNRLTISRNTLGAITQLTEPGGRALTFTVQSSVFGVARITAITDPLGRTVRYSYTSTFPQRLETVTDPAGGVTRYTYDASGRILTITDPRGITFLTNEYDAQGRVSRQTQADGGVWTFQYQGPVGRHTSVTVTDPRGNPTTHRMNNTGFASETVDPLGQPMRMDRDARGQVIATTDPLGRVTRFSYDAPGNVASITDPAGHVRTFAYEPTFNRVTSITDPGGNVTRFGYDAKGNLTSITDPLGAVTALAYNPFGQPARTTDPLGNITTFAYDEAGNLTTTTDPLGNTTRRTYDAVSRLLSLTDPRGFITQFGYDELNRVATITDARQGVTGFTYDANGNLLSVTDAKGQPTTYVYDTMDRLASRTDALNRQERYQYDPAENLTRVTDRKNQQSTFSYDALNRRTAAQYADGSSTRFTYDSVGRLAVAEDSVSGRIGFSYDNLDRLTQELTPQGVVEYSYDALGRRTTMTANGQQPVMYSYDVASRLTQVAQGPQPVGLGYDAAGRRTSLTYPNGTSTTYTYDAASRVTNITHQGPAGLIESLTYAYDAAGNRINLTRANGVATLLPQAVQAAYDAANEQTQFNSITPNLTYHANGNLISQTDANGMTMYTWDARNRLVGITGPSLSASFVYDALGRRVSKTVNGVTTSYLYDGRDILAEIGGSVVNATYLRSLNIDEPFVRNLSDANEYYHADTLRSTVVLTNDAGEIVGTYAYEAFGKATLTGASTNPYQFTGRENDMTGLYYYRSRHYSPTLHRFLSEDLLVLRLASLNLYGYVANNPLSFTDPLGLDRFEACPVGGGCIPIDIPAGIDPEQVRQAIRERIPLNTEEVKRREERVRDIAIDGAKKAAEKVGKKNLKETIENFCKATRGKGCGPVFVVPDVLEELKKIIGPSPAEAALFLDQTNSASETGRVAPLGVRK